MSAQRECVTLPTGVSLTDREQEIHGDVGRLFERLTDAGWHLIVMRPETGTS